MKKKGFTLIELLAVIVILAIIALIATPIVMNTIENAKAGAAERSADNYIDAVETEVAKQRIDGVVLEGEYTIQEDGNLCPDGVDCEAEPNKSIKIDMSGNKPNGGTIIIENGLVVDELSTDTSKKTTMTVDEYTVSYDAEGKQLVASKEESRENTTTTVYRWSTDEIKIEDTIDPSDSTKFATNYAALGKDYFLKHELDADNKVIASYACIKYGDDIACVRGGSAEYYSDSVSILTHLQNEGFMCIFAEDGSLCSDGSISIDVHTDGYVDTYGKDFCYVYADGSSHCKSI